MRTDDKTYRKMRKRAEWVAKKSGLGITVHLVKAKDSADGIHFIVDFESEEKDTFLISIDYGDAMRYFAVQGGSDNPKEASVFLMGEDGVFIAGERHILTYIAEPAFE